MNTDFFAYKTLK